MSPPDMVCFSADGCAHSNAEAAAPEAEPVDEATLIEKRRKRREAIMAKHKASNNPLLIQALTASNNATPSESSPATPDSASPAIGKALLPVQYRRLNFDRFAPNFATLNA